MRLIKKTIAECLRNRVRESADRIALEADEQRYTWKDLDTLSDYMVGRMLSCGIRKGTHVGIWSTNSPNWIIVFLALSKIGAVPVLLNTCYSTEELEQVLRYADVEFVYYGEGYKKLVYEDMVAQLTPKLEGTVKRWIYIGRDTARQWMTEKSFVFAERMKKVTREIGGYIRRVGPEDTAAILFTSGTTAMPKGVMLSHYSLVNSALEICSHMGWEDSDKMMIAVPLFHCFGLTASLLTSIHTGCCMHTVEYYKTITVLQTVQKHHCTVLNGVPSMFLAITRNPAHKDYDLAACETASLPARRSVRKNMMPFAGKFRGCSFMHLTDRRKPHPASASVMWEIRRQSVPQRQDGYCATARYGSWRRTEPACKQGKTEKSACVATMSCRAIIICRKKRQRPLTRTDGSIPAIWDIWTDGIFCISQGA